MIIKDSYLTLLFIAGALTCCKTEQKEKEASSDYYEIAEPTTKKELTQEELITRGKYVVMTSGCNDCHSPKVMTDHGPDLDPTRLLSGHNQNEPLPPLPKDAGRNGFVMFSMGLTSAIGPWGITYAANLTPDDTGIGSWTYENFKTAITKGKYKGLEGGRDLLPPMPWQVYRNMTEEDLLSIFTYLKSIPKVSNLVPAPQPPQPEKISSLKK